MPQVHDFQRASGRGDRQERSRQTSAQVIDAFMQYLWSDEAQQAFVKFHFYSSTNERFEPGKPGVSAQIEMPFTIEYFGGWERAYPEMIEEMFRDQSAAKVATDKYAMQRRT